MSDHNTVSGGGPRAFTHRHQFTLIGLITLATLIAVVAGGTWLERRTVATSGEMVSIMAAEVSAKLDLLLNERVGDVQFLAESLAMHGTTPAARTHILSTFYQAYPLYLWIGIVDPAGRITEATIPQARGLDVRATGWFQAARRERAGFHVGDIAADEAGHGADCGSSAGCRPPPVPRSGYDAGERQADGTTGDRSDPAVPAADVVLSYGGI